MFAMPTFLNSIQFHVRLRISRTWNSWCPLLQKAGRLNFCRQVVSLFVTWMKGVSACFLQPRRLAIINFLIPILNKPMTKPY